MRSGLSELDVLLVCSNERRPVHRTAHFCRRELRLLVCGRHRSLQVRCWVIICSKNAALYIGLHTSVRRDTASVVCDVIGSLQSLLVIICRFRQGAPE